MVHRTGQIHRLQERHQFLGAALVDAVASGQDVDLIEDLEQLGRGLMDGANNGASLAGQLLEQLQDLCARATVQATERKKSKM